jgi:Domain of unknown function (DUF4062)
VVIRTPDRRLRVFVSSSLGELAEERRAVSRAISALRLTPVMFELGARPYPPREVYQQYLAQSDVFIGLYWQRYGQLVPGLQVSGLDEEFELSAGCPGCCMSRRRRPIVRPAWLICWPASSRRPRPPTAPSAPLPSWAGWSAMTWRCC